MPKRWTFYGFDWERYHEIAPVLRRAVDTQSFEAVDLDGAEETLAEWGHGHDARTVAGALVSDLCAVGEPAVLDAGVPELVRRIRRHEPGEDAADLLALLLTGRPNVEGWFGGPAAPVGLLTAAQTHEVARGLERVAAEWKPTSPRGLRALARRLATSDPAHVRLSDLVQASRQAAEGGHGLAALAED